MSQLAMILDRMVEDLAVARQRVKDQLTAFVDRRFDQLQAEVDAVRSRVLKQPKDLLSNQLASEWPEPVTITYQDYKAARKDEIVQPPGDIFQSAPSTSGIKRKRSSPRPIVTKRS